MRVWLFDKVGKMLNEYPQNMFSWRNEKYSRDTHSYLDLCHSIGPSTPGITIYWVYSVYDIHSPWSTSLSDAEYFISDFYNEGHDARNILAWERSNIQCGYTARLSQD